MNSTPTKLMLILDRCAQLDDKAAVLYESFAADAPTPEAKNFWLNMAHEEKDHSELWNKMHKLAELGVLPEVFDNPDLVLTELDHILVDSARCRERYLGDPNTRSAILCAYNLEFAMMHQAFLKLAQFYNTLWENPEPLVNYTQHIAGFVKGAHQLGVGGEEWELLSRTMIRLYRENDLLLRQSAVDRLTGLYHRDSLLPFVHTMAHLARRNNEAVAAVLIQVDDLSTIRDENDPEAANQVLRAIGRKLSSDIRKSDLLGRYTDDTFLVFLSQVEPAGLHQLGEMLHREAEAVARDLPATVSCAAACAVIREDVEHEVKLLLRQVEKLLADAKRKGSGQLVVQADYPRMKAAKKKA